MIGGRQYVLLLLMVLAQLNTVIMAQVYTHDVRTQIAMRSIGHELLRQSGNDTTQLAAIEQKGRDYTIALGNDFHFVPDSLVKTVDAVIASYGISQNYFVQVFTCGSDEMAYGYGFDINDSSMNTPCLGRFQPRDCYTLTISLIDKKSEPKNTEAKDVSKVGNEVASDKASSVVSQLLLVFVMIGLVALYSWNNKRLEKSEANMTNHITLGRYIFDFRHLKLSIDGSTSDLTSKEADLLVLLFQHLNETVERGDILKEVWGDEGSYDGRTLDVYISKLRKKLELDPAIKIINVRGVGYKMAVSNEM
jgi:DNA-binding winged helix-turn-helix (wHTH) protein